MAHFGDVVTAMVTPFGDDEGQSLDLDGAAALARWLTDNGSDGIVVAGTTGEGPVLTDDERMDLVEAVAGAVTVPVIAGTGTNDTMHSVRLTEEAKSRGAAGVLIVTPYYNRPSQAGIEGHVRACAGATDLPVVLYDIPFRTGRKMATDTILKLAREVKNVVAVKDAAGDVHASAQVVAEAPAGFELYSGEDSLTLPLLSIGAVGVVSVASHWAGAEFGEMITAFRKGDVERARQLNARLLESCSFESGDANPNPIPTKAMMRTLGQPAGQCRLPMGPAPAGLDDRAREVYGNLRNG